MNNPLNRRPIAALPSDPALWSIAEQRRAIDSAELSAVELLAASVSRYERFNGTINAVVATKIDEARRRAAAVDTQVDTRVRAGGLESDQTLAGIPVTVKEVFDWAGTTTTWGVSDLADYRPDRNADAIDLLLGAGVVLYGKTNVPRMLGDWQTYNELHGVTNNPWDLDRTPGGSSGGSAAAVATGMSSLELGSDIGGSIRFPAHYTGVYGHKPTFDAVPIRGHTFPGHDGAVDVNVAGPLTRSADDLALALRVLAPNLRWGDQPLDLAGYKVGVVLNNPIGPQDSAMTAVLRGVIDRLADLGVAAVDNAQPNISGQEAFEVATMLVRAATSVHDAPADDYADDVRRYAQGDRDYLAISARATTMSHRDWIALHNARGAHQRRWAEFFSEYDLLLCPVAASPAPPHDFRPFAETEILIDDKPSSTIPQWFWAGWPGAMYLPSTVAPVGTTPDGLPVGLQIIAAHGNDAASIAFAQLMEQELGGFTSPPGYE